MAIFGRFSTLNDRQGRNIWNLAYIEPSFCSPEFCESVACHVGPVACISPEEIDLAQDHPRGKNAIF